MKSVILIIVAWIICCSFVSGFSVNIEETGNDFIQWNWSETPISNISIDGVYVCDLDYNAHQLTLSDLGDNQLHTIIVYKNDTVNGTSSARTTTSGNYDVGAFIKTYLFFIVACIFLILAVAYEGYFAFVSFIFGGLGIIQSLNNSFWLGTLYMIVIVASIFVSYTKYGE